MVLGQLDNSVSNSPASLYLPYNMLYMSARATYTYDNRYTAEVNVGINGSEQFSKENRWGIFPAVSVGWTVSEEKFFKDNIDRKWIDFLKIRASYGIVGNDRLGESRFLYLDDVRVTYNQGYVNNGHRHSVAGARQLRCYLAAGQPQPEMGKGAAAELRPRH